MNVYLYNVSDDENHMYKDLSTQIGAYSGAVRGELQIDSPQIMIEATIETANYAYIPDFERYYWIKAKTVVRDNMTLLHLVSDPLQSFASQILNLAAYVYRSDTDYNMDIIDSKTPRVVYDRVQVLAPQGIGGIPQFNATDTNIYLQCIGGE